MKRCGYPFPFNAFDGEWLLFHYHCPIPAGRLTPKIANVGFCRELPFKPCSRNGRKVPISGGANM
jgi:hypothetical protein